MGATSLENVGAGAADDGVAKNRKYGRTARVIGAVRFESGVINAPEVAGSLLDGATDGAGLRDGDGFAGEDGIEGIPQVVAGRRGAPLAEVDVGIVDASAVGNGAAGREDDGFGCDFGAEAFDQFPHVVEEDGAGVAEFAGVGPGALGGEAWVRVDDPEADAAAGVVGDDPVDLRGERVGDGAVGGEEEEDGCLGVAEVQWPHVSAVDVAD